MEILKYTSDSGTSKFESSHETKNVRSKKNRKRFYSWCAPRKTKAVSSAGEFLIDFTSNPKVKTRKSRKRTGTEKVNHKKIKNQKRIIELSRPRKMVLESSQNFPPIIKVSRNQKCTNDFSRPERVIFASSQNSPQGIKGIKLTSNSDSSLRNFGIAEKTTKPKMISRKDWMERINKLAEPRVREPTPTNIIGKVAEKALHATASKRIKELAKRKLSTAANPQEKNNDPYKVNPQALKAICSTRTKSLAIPKIFRIHSHYCNKEKIVY